MRIAIFHDYIGAIGGGEKLVLMLARGLGADVITTDVDEDSVRKMGFEDVNYHKHRRDGQDAAAQAEFSCKSTFFYNKRWGKPQTPRWRRRGQISKTYN